ncbi:MAG: transcription elongation factor GreA [Mycoplasmatota bacterium]
MKKQIYLTKQGLEDIKEELAVLVNEKRPEVIEALKDARAQGDLSENAEYDAARNDQAFIEARISELESIVENAQIIVEENTGKVSLGNKVTLKYMEDDDTEIYSIVGSKEADPFTNKISNESPIASAILGKAEGEQVTVESPNGKYDVLILSIA